MAVSLPSCKVLRRWDARANPINRDTLNLLYGLETSSPEAVQDFYDQVRVNIPNPSNAEEMVISQVGEELYNKFFKGYTLKQ